MRFLVYLAGPIHGLSHRTSTEWRDYANGKFPDEITGMSPMRGKPYLREVTKLTGAYEDWPLSGQRGIYARDRFDCRRADLILVNLLGAEKVSVGTVMEIAWGADNSIPVVLVMEDGNVHEHPMIREACPFIVPTLDEGIDLVSAILLPVPH